MTDEVVVEKKEEGTTSTATASTTNTTTVDYESEARKYGWVPKEEFHGNETEWKDAETFVKRGQEILGFVRKELNKTKEQLTVTKTEFEQFRKDAEEFKKYREQAEENAYKRAMSELRAQQKKAIELGDGEAFSAVEEEIERLKEEKKKVKETKTQEVDPVMVQNQRILETWLSDGNNQLFARDKEVMALANDYAEVVRLDPKTKHLTGTDFLDEVAERVREAAPHKFDNPARARPSAVGSSSDAGNTRGNGSKKKSYADLPEDAKKACDKFVKNGWLTKEKYVEDYFQGE